MRMEEITGAILTHVDYEDVLTYDPMWGHTLDIRHGDVTESHPVYVVGSRWGAAEPNVVFDETFTDAHSAMVWAMRYLEMQDNTDLDALHSLTVCDPT